MTFLVYMEPKVVYIDTNLLLNINICQKKVIMWVKIDLFQESALTTGSDKSALKFFLGMQSTSNFQERCKTKKN